MLKKAIQAFLQRLLGFDRYLFYFSRFKIHTLRWDGPRREGDFLHFLSLLPADAVVLDIGANIGIMTVLMARQCPQGQVYAFEPVPENFRALSRVVSHYRLPNVSLHQVALGEQAGTIRMAMPVLKGVRMQGLTHVDHGSIDGYEGEYVHYEVPQASLDGWSFAEGTRIHALKMDVENYEQYVLSGARQLLETHRPMLYIELWDNENRRQCMALLSELGYQSYVLERKQLTPYRPGLHRQHNFFFLPQNP
ncbi:MAG: FkbM family methyltransferase [Bacteroidetes bacterium]|nr:MAG: FkbM family methyltransferase [Bacteroidota bacterium]